MSPTLREVLDGYELFNSWELEEQKRELPLLSVEEGLAQFFELCALTREFAPDLEQLVLEHDKVHWMALRRRLRRVAEVMESA